MTAESDLKVAVGLAADELRMEVMDDPDVHITGGCIV
jgi:hypothetical protein